MSSEIQEPEETERVTVPLVMLPGNMQVLLKLAEEGQHLNVAGISLKWSEEFPAAVVLLVSGVDKEQAEELGFQTRREGRE